MEIERIEYLRRSGRKKGKKKGVLWCGIDSDNEDGVVVGFSLCHSIDEFDYVNGQRKPGFGLEIAKDRADKWRFHSEYFVQKSYSEEELEIGLQNGGITLYINPNPSTIVEIPPSVIDRLAEFLVRCKKYYKDKEFPDWCESVLKGLSLNLKVL
jgi:hypothetical protein